MGEQEFNHKLTFIHTAAGERENQDRGAIITCESRQILVVADGAGGISGGAEAADMASEFIRKHAELLRDTASCISVLHKMDQAIAEKSNAGETTCVLAVVTGCRVFGASVGDSGILAIGEAGVTDLTQSQSRKPFIGSGSASIVPFSHEMENGECLLLATDGLLKYASRERIAAICLEFTAESATKHLIELVRYQSGALPDDVTVILTKL